MISLRELQAGFAGAVRTGAADEVAAEIAADEIGAVARLGIYRTHYLVTLTDVLVATFPVVRTLLGERAFAATVRRFVQAAPPEAPCLSEYGRRFPEWLAADGPAAQPPCLADVARLEWALAVAENACDAPSLSAGDLAAAPPEALATAGFALHPSASLVATRFAVDRIWRAARVGGADPLDRAEGDGARLLVHRRAAEAGWLSLPAPEFAFVRALAHGATLTQAAAAAAEIPGPFDPAALLAALIDGQVFRSFTTHTCRESSL
jgi:hypothetical protein